MFPNLNNIIYFVLISIIIILCGIVSYEKKSCKAALNKLNIANIQLTLLQNEAILQKQRIDEANKKSKVEEKANREKLRNLMRSSVPKDCNQSIQWGIKKAYEF